MCRLYSIYVFIWFPFLFFFVLFGYLILHDCVLYCFKIPCFLKRKNPYYGLLCFFFLFCFNKYFGLLSFNSQAPCENTVTVEGRKERTNERTSTTVEIWFIMTWFREVSVTLLGCVHCQKNYVVCNE